MHGSRIDLECLSESIPYRNNCYVCVLRKMSLYVNVPVYAANVSSIPSSRIVTIRDIKLSTECSKARSTSSPIVVHLKSEVVVGTPGKVEPNGVKPCRWSSVSCGGEACWSPDTMSPRPDAPCPIDQHRRSTNDQPTANPVATVSDASHLVLAGKEGGSCLLYTSPSPRDRG